MNRKSRAASAARAIPRSGSGGVAQLGERLLCKQEVIGSIPFGSTIDRSKNSPVDCFCRSILSREAAKAISRSESPGKAKRETIERVPGGKRR